MNIVNTVASELGSPEAPLFLPDASFLCVEMSPDKGSVTQFSADWKARRQLARTGRPNGLALDRHGMLWVAETAQRAVLRMSLDGRYTVFADACRGEPFLFLNYPTNLAFSQTRMYVTEAETGTLQVYDVETPGFPLHV